LIDYPLGKMVAQKGPLTKLGPERPALVSFAQGPRAVADGRGGVELGERGLELIYP